MMMGDFNDIASRLEQWGGEEVNVGNTSISWTTCKNATSLIFKARGQVFLGLDNRGEDSVT